MVSSPTFSDDAGLRAVASANKSLAVLPQHILDGRRTPEGLERLLSVPRWIGKGVYIAWLHDIKSANLVQPPLLTHHLPTVTHKGQKEL
jgi:hypothetical protein